MMSKVFKSYDLNWWLKPTVSLYETDMDRNLGRRIEIELIIMTRQAKDYQ